MTKRYNPRPIGNPTSVYMHECDDGLWVALHEHDALLRERAAAGQAEVEVDRVAEERLRERDEEIYALQQQCQELIETNSKLAEELDRAKEAICHLKR